MKNFILFFLDRLSWLIEKTGVNYAQLRAIVAVKLTMDDRRHIVAHAPKARNAGRRTFLKTFIVYTLFGCLIGMILTYYTSFTLSMMIFFSYLMVMITMTLITDFSSVLLDTSDNTIILPRPVDSRTFFAARSVHIFSYLALITVALSLAPFAAVVYEYSIAVIAGFIAGIVLSVLFAVFFTHLLYLLVIRFTSEEKIRNWINYLQIFMTVAIVGAYQLGPRMFSRLEYQHYQIDLWSFIVPPAWMAAMLEGIYYSRWEELHIALTALAVLAPVGGFFVVDKFLTKTFTRKLQSFDKEVAKPVNGPLVRKSLAQKCSRFFSSDPIERLSFEWISKMLARDRKFKLRIYPAFGYMAVFVVVFLMRDNENWQSSAAALPDFPYMILIYLIFMVLQVAIHELAYSDDYRASWILFSAPVEQPGKILLGGLKAIVFSILIPAYLVIAVLVIALWGVDTIPNLFIGFFNNCLMMVTLALLQQRYLPFSVAPSTRAQSGTFVRSLITLVLVALLGLSHFLLSLLLVNSPFIWAAVPVQIILLYFLMQDYRNTTWKKISF